VRLVPSLVPAGSPIDVTPGVGGQYLSTHRTSAEAANGDYAVVWENGPLGIYGRLFGPDGTPLASPFHVAGTGASDAEATVAMDAGGAFAIAWTHTGRLDAGGGGGGTQSVEMERFSPAGVSLGPPSVITSATHGGSAHQPSVAVDTAGDVVVAYTDSAGAKNQVKAMLYAGGGSPTALTVTSSTATSQPSAAMNAAGTFVIAFTENVGATNQDVYVQRFKPGGAPQGSAIGVATTSHVEDQPSAAIDAQGDFVVAYTYIRSSQVDHNPPPIGNITDNLSEVRASLYKSQGTLVKADTVWASSKITEDGYDPSAAMDAAGNFVVGYTKGGNDGAYDPQCGVTSVWAAAYDKKGALLQAGINLAANMPANSNADVGARGTVFDHNSMPSVALSPSGHLVADWQNFGIEYNGDLAGTGVFTQTFVQAPFQYQLLGGTTIKIIGGMPTQYKVDITRDPGFTGAISLNFLNLPAGVTFTVSPDNPVHHEVLTITFSSDDAVPGGSIWSTLEVMGGGVTLKPKVLFNVYPSYISGWTTTDPDGTTLVKGTATTITGAGFVPDSTVQFGSPSATATPTNIDKSGQSLTVTVPMNAVSGPITIVRPGGQSIVSSTSAVYTEGGVNSLSTNIGYAPGYDSFCLNTGSEVDIAGYGFQPGAKVIFGTPGTSDPKVLAQLEATPSFIGNNGTWMKVNVPRYALSGPVEVIEPDGTVLTAPGTFTVENYRNTFGFSFENFNFNIDWGNVKGEFGGNQVDFTLFGWDTGVPNPQGLTFWAIAAATLNGKGACFGMSLTSVLMSPIYQPWLINANNGLPNGAAPTVYNLQRNGALDEMIEENHLAQYSAEVIHYYAQWQAENALHQITASTIYNEIDTALKAGDHPIISMQAGADHSVVAYDLEPGPKGNGDYFIDVYDPNRPFNDGGNENTGAAHAGVEQVSRIYVDPFSGWSFTMADNSNHSGGWGTLEVIPVGLVSGGVTLPLSLDGLGHIIFGSSSSSVPAFSAQVGAPRSLVLPADLGPAPAPAQSATDAVFSTPSDTDVTWPVAQARAAVLMQSGIGKRGVPTGANAFDLLAADQGGLIDAFFGTGDAWLRQHSVNPQPLPP
jgi:hypothetical protein